VATTEYGDPLSTSADVTVHVATPEESAEVLLVSQSTTEPVAEVRANVTVPAGVPAEEGTPVTVAVTVAELPDPVGGFTVTWVLEPACETFCVNVPLDAAKLPSPEYATVTVYGPLAAKSSCVATLQVVLPLVLFTASLLDWHGITLAELLVIVQVTVPVGWPTPGEPAATMAEKLAAFDVIVGFALALMVTVEGDLSTVCVSGVAVEPVNAPVWPEYVTLTVTGDWARVSPPEMVQVAWPFVSATTSPFSQARAGRCPAPFVGAGSVRAKVTEPVAVPAAGATALTVAVKVTDCPLTEGLAEDVRTVALAPALTVKL
jgi:hypothetical protein